MVHLRKMEPSDVAFLYQWENDASAWADSDNHNPLSMQDLRDYVASTTGDIYKDGQLRLIIENEAVTIGCVDLFEADFRNRKAAIGIYIAHKWRGMHLGEQAIEQLMHYAFDYLHLRMLYAVVLSGNKVCNRIFQNLGFTPSATLHKWTLEGDAVVWQMENDCATNDSL